VTLSSLAPSDVTAAARLSAAVGWNQNEADWDRLIALQPDGVFAERDGDRLIGTATLMRYGHDLAWLGMVIVDKGRRGAGLGAALVDAALAAAPGVTIGLDATHLGAPLYLRRGFKSAGTVERWTGVLQPVSRAAGGGSSRRAYAADAAALSAFDRQHAGVDRSRLLARLLTEPSTTVVVVEHSGPLGYAALRRGREQLHVGPVVAGDVDSLAVVMNGVASLAGGAPLFVDVPASGLSAAGAPGQVTRDWPAAFGLQRARTLTRMVRLSPSAPHAPATPRLLVGPSLAAATGLEWG